MNYASYIRVSTQKQGQSGLGLEAQRRDIQIFLDSYAKGASLVKEFIEVESGKLDDREEFKKAVDFCEANNCTLVVAKLDRLSRKVSFIAGLIERKNFQFKVAQMPHADKFQLHIYAALAEQERDFISQRTKAALAVKKSQGVKLGAAAHKEACHTKNLKRQPKAATMFASKFQSQLKIYRDLGMTYESIADKLNKSGHTTREGATFTKMQVQRMCKRLEIK